MFGRLFGTHHGSPLEEQPPMRLIGNFDYEYTGEIFSPTEGDFGYYQPPPDTSILQSNYKYDYNSVIEVPYSTNAIKEYGLVRPMYAI